MYSNFLYGDVHHGIYGWKMCLMATHKLILNLGITVFKLFIWGGISWDIWSENVFDGDAQTDT